MSAGKLDAEALKDGASMKWSAHDINSIVLEMDPLPDTTASPSSQAAASLNAAFKEGVLQGIKIGRELASQSAQSHSQQHETIPCSSECTINNGICCLAHQRERLIERQKEQDEAMEEERRWIEEIRLEREEGRWLPMDIRQRTADDEKERETKLQGQLNLIVERLEELGEKEEPHKWEEPSMAVFRMHEGLNWHIQNLEKWQEENKDTSFELYEAYSLPGKSASRDPLTRTVENFEGRIRKLEGSIMSQSEEFNKRCKTLNRKIDKTLERLYDVEEELNEGRDGNEKRDNQYNSDMLSLKDQVRIVFERLNKLESVSAPEAERTLLQGEADIPFVKANQISTDYSKLCKVVDDEASDHHSLNGMEASGEERDELSNQDSKGEELKLQNQLESVIHRVQALEASATSSEASAPIQQSAIRWSETLTQEANYIRECSERYTQLTTLQEQLKSEISGTDALECILLYIGWKFRNLGEAHM
ncbi:hypothetical protein BJ508DRAFT_309180 [Ascobolus immersus RN42]|uniref:Uncharacterized protein n=1 Tax=Ascobolus immersus RN42 TaxID=1160509 RepID=A0A3N4HXJ4_ASCIM|nr:hypothetical protein BJ508DRAFT_309180 [Ascobolus immersus RN42]